MRKLVMMLAVALMAAACANSRAQESLETAADVVVEQQDDGLDESTGDEPEPIIIAPDEPDEPEPEPEPVATLEPLDADVEHAPSAGSFQGITAPTLVAVGDLARTNDSGFGEIRYTDGSFTRLDAATEFEIVELIDDPTAPRVEARLDIGRTWHRVQDLAGTDGAFVVDTAVATASVRGTAFSAVCEVRDTCSFVVTEGVVEVVTFDGTVILLNEGEGVIVSTDDLNPATAVSEHHRRVSIGGPGLVIDDWVQTNAALDESRGGFVAPSMLEATPIDLTGEYEYRASSYSTAETIRIETTCFSGVCVPTIATGIGEDAIRLDGSYPNGWFSEWPADVDSTDDRCVYTMWSSVYLDVTESSPADGGDRVDTFVISHTESTAIVDVIDPPHECGQSGTDNVFRTYRRTGD
ncbi:MAG: FecR domain-containing protein [Actinomycetota bacterium]